jgi:predicted acylesterase/phospholipase RssA
MGVTDRSEAALETVFVLSGGGNLGAVQVGMLYALLEAGIKPDAIFGSSIGALNGAFLASHADLAGMEELAELWVSVHRREVFPMSVAALLRGVFGHQQFLFESLGLRSLLLRASFGFERIEDAPIMLRVMATDLSTGEAVVLDSGETIKALLASSAIPGVFPPVEIDDRILIDDLRAAHDAGSRCARTGQRNPHDAAGDGSGGATGGAEGACRSCRAKKGSRSARARRCRPLVDI